jgi:hypothetical protein
MPNLTTATGLNCHDLPTAGSKPVRATSTHTAPPHRELAQVAGQQKTASGSIDLQAAPYDA